MEAAGSYETFVHFYQTTWHYINEDKTVYSHLCENLKCHNLQVKCPF